MFIKNITFKQICNICLVFLLTATFIFAKENADTIKRYYLPSVTITTERSALNKNSVITEEITQSKISQIYTTQDLPMLLTELPSLFAYSQNGNGIGYTTVSMRGFDQRRISVNINGIPQNDPEDHNVYWIDFPDLTSNLESIEVQRGAGSNINGSPAIGGAINMQTSNFVNKKGVKLSTGFGFQEFAGKEDGILQNTSKNSIEVSSGLIETNQKDVAYSIYSRFSQINSIGYRDQSWANLSSYFLGFARFDKNFSTQINLFGGPLRDGLAYTGIPKEDTKDEEKRLINYNYWSYDSTGKNVSYTQLRRKQEKEEFSQPHFELLNDFSINENISGKSSLFFYTGVGYFDYDGTGWTDANSFALTEENGFVNAEDPQNPIIRAFVENKHFGWIPRFKFDFDKFTLGVNAEVRYHFSDHWGKIAYAENLPTNYNPDYKFYSYEGNRKIASISSSLEYRVTEKLYFDANAQLIWNNYSILNDKVGNNYRTFHTPDGYTTQAKGELFNISYLFLNPKVSINCQMNNHNSLSALFAITSREPRMANLYNASEAFSGKAPNFKSIELDGKVMYDFTEPLVKPETMYDFEIGHNLKYQNFGLKANVYFMLYKDELVKSGQIDVFGDPIDGNAPQTRHIGIEFSGNYNFLKTSLGNFSLTGNLTYSQNKIIEYEYSIGSGKTIDLSENDIAGFPNLLANTRLNFSNDRLFISIQYQYIGDYKTDNFGEMLTANQDLINYLGWDYYADNNLEAYTLINFDFSYNIGKLNYFENIRLQFKVNNLLNKLYAAGAEGKEFFPGAERNFYFGTEISF